jgi:hypothetical protein
VTEQLLGERIAEVPAVIGISEKSALGSYFPED